MTPRSQATVPPIETRDLHVYYGESYVLRGVSIRVFDGQVTAVLGRNGVGKTTLIHTVMGLLPCREGSVWIFGEEATRHAAWRRARTGLALVPQGRRVFPSLTVHENIVIGQRTGDTWDLDRLYELFPNLKERTSIAAGRLSGGEQQMLAIARALHTSPRVLLLDEPSEGLAPIILERLEDLLSELKRAGMTLLLVEQNLKLALTVADDTYVMAKGDIVYEGTAADLEGRVDVQREHLGV